MPDACAQMFARSVRWESAQQQALVLTSSASEPLAPHHTESESAQYQCNC